MNRRPINDYILEMFLHGTLPNKINRQIKNLIKIEKTLRDKIENKKKSNLEFKKEFPAEQLIPNIIKRYESQKDMGTNEILLPQKSFKPWYFSVTAVAVVLLLIIVLFPVKEVNKNSEPDNHTILKGSDQVDLSQPQLLIHRKNDSRIEILTNEAKGKAGDLLQLAYISADQDYGVIFSIDGNGKITLHYPLNSTDSTALVQGKYYFPEAIELDNAPGFERFFFITSRSRIKVDFIIKKARQLAIDPAKAKNDTLDLPEGLKQVSIKIIKEQ